MLVICWNNRQTINVSWVLLALCRDMGGESGPPLGYLQELKAAVIEIDSIWCKDLKRSHKFKRIVFNHKHIYIFRDTINENLFCF